MEQTKTQQQETAVLEEEEDAQQGVLARLADPAFRAMVSSTGAAGTHEVRLAQEQDERAFVVREVDAQPPPAPPAERVCCGGVEYRLVGGAVTDGQTSLRPAVAHAPTPAQRDAACIASGVPFCAHPTPAQQQQLKQPDQTLSGAVSLDACGAVLVVTLRSGHRLLLGPRAARIALLPPLLDGVLAWGVQRGDVCVQAYASPTPRVAAAVLERRGTSLVELVSDLTWALSAADGRCFASPSPRSLHVGTSSPRSLLLAASPPLARLSAALCADAFLLDGPALLASVEARFGDGAEQLLWDLLAQDLPAPASALLASRLRAGDFPLRASARLACLRQRMWRVRLADTPQASLLARRLSSLAALCAAHRASCFAPSDALARVEAGAASARVAAEAALLLADAPLPPHALHAPLALLADDAPRLRDLLVACCVEAPALLDRLAAAPDDVRAAVFPRGAAARATALLLVRRLGAQQQQPHLERETAERAVRAALAADCGPAPFAALLEARGHGLAALRVALAGRRPEDAARALGALGERDGRVGAALVGAQDAETRDGVVALLLAAGDEERALWVRGAAGVVAERAPWLLWRAHLAEGRTDDAAEAAARFGLSGAPLGQRQAVLREAVAAVGLAGRSGAALLRADGMARCQAALAAHAARRGRDRAAAALCGGALGATALCRACGEEGALGVLLACYTHSAQQSAQTAARIRRVWEAALAAESTEEQQRERAAVAELLAGTGGAARRD